MPSSKSRMVFPNLLLAATCFLVLPVQAAQKLEVKTLVDEVNTELYSPVFIPGSAKVAFVKKKHEPDFHEAEAYSESELQAFRGKSETDPRWSDPEVTLLPGDGTASIKVDYGWNPEASTKGDQLYYVHQKKPISGKRVLAETQAGNEIFAYDIATNKSREVAAPESGYLDLPTAHPTDDMIAYAICDATNGAYGGNVGIGIYDATKGTRRTALAPAKHFELYDLVGSPIWVGSNLVVARRTPLGKGVWLADSYKFDVLNLAGEAPKVIYDRKEPVDLVKNQVHIEYLAGKLAVSDDAKSVEIAPDDGKVLNETTLSSDSELKPLGSPDGSHEFSMDGKKIVVKNRQSGETLTALVTGELVTAVWSPGSRRMLMVMTINKKKNGEEVFDRDRLLQVDLPESF